MELSVTQIAILQHTRMNGIVPGEIVVESLSEEREVTVEDLDVLEKEGLICWKYGYPHSKDERSGNYLILTEYGKLKVKEIKDRDERLALEAEAQGYDVYTMGGDIDG